MRANTRGVLEDRRAPFVEAVEAGDAARGFDDMRVAALILADQVARAADGLQGGHVVRLIFLGPGDKFVHLHPQRLRHPRHCAQPRLVRARLDRGYHALV